MRDLWPGGGTVNKPLVKPADNQTDHRRSEAHTLALQAVQFILSNEQLAGGFIAATGATPDDLKSLITKDDFLSGVLDYLMGREDVLLAFCENIDLDPDHAVRLHQSLNQDRVID